MDLPKNGQSVSVTLISSPMPVSMHFHRLEQFGRHYEVFIDHFGDLFQPSDLSGWAEASLLDGVEYFYIDPNEPNPILACVVDDVRHHAAAPWSEVALIGIREMSGGRMIERPGYVGSPRLRSHRDCDGLIWVDKPFTAYARDWLVTAMETLKKMNKRAA